MFSRSRDARGPTRHPSPRTAPLPRLILSSRSPWPPLTPPRVSFAHAEPSRRAPRSRLSPAGGTERLRPNDTGRRRGRTKGSEVTSRSLTVTVDAVPSLLLSAPPPSLFSSSASLRREEGPRTLLLPPLPLLSPSRVRLLLPFRNFDALESDFPPVPSPLHPSSVPPMPPCVFTSRSSLFGEESSSAKVDRLYPVNQVAS